MLVLRRCGIKLCYRSYRRDPLTFKVGPGDARLPLQCWCHAPPYGSPHQLSSPPSPLVRSQGSREYHCYPPQSIHLHPRESSILNTLVVALRLLSIEVYRSIIGSKKPFIVALVDLFGAPNALTTSIEDANALFGLVFYPFNRIVLVELGTMLSLFTPVVKDGWRGWWRTRQ